jgi:hypothetical protein
MGKLEFQAEINSKNKNAGLIWYYFLLYKQ